MAAQSFAARLDRLPLSRFHYRLLLVSGLGWMFDAMDILILGAVVAAVARDPALGVDSGTAFWITSLNQAGLFFGALAAGWAADRYGRKLIFQVTLLIYSVMTGLAALAWNAASLMVLRFLTGIGLGGELPVASTLVSEFAPARRRGAMVVLLESFWAYGAVLAALLSYVLIPQFGWRAAFLVGALPALYVFVLRRSIPESPRFLASQGRLAEAESVVRAVEKSAGVESAAPGPVAGAAEPAPAGRVRLGDLFAPGYRARTVVLWAMWATMNFSYYGIFLWLPTQFTRKGFDLEQALLFNLIIALAQIPGYFSAAYLIERLGRRLTLVLYLFLAAVGAFFFGQIARQPQLVAADVPGLLAWGSVISFFNLGAWGVVYAYSPELYPTRLRATGAGWAAGFGRIWAFLAPLSISLQLTLLGSDQTVFLLFTAVMVIGGLIVLALGPETRGKTLEQIAGA